MKWVWRILAVLVALPLLCAGVLWAMGMRTGAGRSHASIEVRGTPTEIWPWLDKGDRLKQWVSWLVEVRENDTAAVVGSRRVWVMRDGNNGGALMEIPFTFTEYTPPMRMTVRTTMPDMFEGRSTFSLTDLGNGMTRMESDGEYHYQMWMARLMEPVITPRAAAKMSSDLIKLKEVVEKSQTAAAR